MFQTGYSCSLDHQDKRTGVTLCGDDFQDRVIRGNVQSENKNSTDMIENTAIRDSTHCMGKGFAWSLGFLSSNPDDLQTEIRKDCLATGSPEPHESSEPARIVISAKCKPVAPVYELNSLA